MIDSANLHLVNVLSCEVPVLFRITDRFIHSYLRQEILQEIKSKAICG